MKCRHNGRVLVHNAAPMRELLIDTVDSRRNVP
jgi:hypothetical protein